MKRSQRFRADVLVSIFVAAATVVPISLALSDAKTPTKFLRLEEKKNGDATLDTAIVTYENKDGVTVHLVGAVHVGEQSYFDGLEKTFAKYDALLYELVKKKGVDVKDLQRERHKKAGGGLTAVTLLQRWLTDTLKLEFQLDGIDYTRDNFVHADLDLETFVSLQKERGESLLGLMLRALKHNLQRRARGEKIKEVTIVDLVRIFLSKDRTREMKLVLARQIGDIEAQLAGLEGPNGSVILTERNKAAIRVLKETIGKGKKDIGVFYGAAHMQDIEIRIRKLGFKKKRTEWRVAWDMTETETAPPEKKAPPPATKKPRPAEPNQRRF